VLKGSAPTGSSPLFTTNTMRMFRFKPGYLPIPALQERPTVAAKDDGAKRIRHLLVIPAVAVLSFTLGVITAAAILAPAGPPADNDFLQPAKLDITIPIVRQAFKYNRTFSEDPHLNTTTAQAWDDLVPRMSRPRTAIVPMLTAMTGGQGSVRYPPATPQVYTLSAVHQLHCLVRLSPSFVAQLDTASPGSRAGGPSAPFRPLSTSLPA
jgi:hypothetical protein